MNSLRELDEAYRSLSRYMNSFVSRKKDEISSDSTYTVDARNGNDLFTSLVRANMQDGKFGLSDEELVTLSSSDSVLPVLI
jgi:cytochrome P450